MRPAAFAPLLAALLVSGCAGRKAAATHPQAGPGFASSSPSRPAQGQNLIVTPATALVGKVISVNAPGRFVVLNFPPGQMPPSGQRLSLYRDGLKTAELELTNSRDEDNVIANVLSGEAHLGDEAREN